MSELNLKTQSIMRDLLEKIDKMEFVSTQYFVFTFVLEQDKTYLLEYQPLIHSRFFPGLMAINWEKSDIFIENLRLHRKNSRIIKVTKLTNFDNLRHNNYSLKDKWQHAKDEIFQNYSARYINGQILAKKPFYGYLIENTG